MAMSLSFFFFHLIFVFYCSFILINCHGLQVRCRREAEIQSLPNFIQKTQAKIIHTGTDNAAPLQNTKKTTDKDRLKRWAITAKLTRRLDTPGETIKGTNETK